VSVLASRRPDRAGRAALAHYSEAPASTRLHTRVRWWSAPFPDVVAVLPPSGRVLEIGCGHGLFSLYAALDSPSRTVLGVDIDAGKIAEAQAAVGDLAGRVRFAEGVSGVVPEGPWDAVVVIDVLYLLSEGEQRRLLTAALAEIAPGGLLVVKEMARRPTWKARWNRAQEHLSVRLLRITEGNTLTFLEPAHVAGWLEQLGATTTLLRLDQGRLHPHHLLVARVPTVSAACRN
jgi:2-polyprenyl-3-methyl-5-hydroxy-6-metoxy-1,4-benzoquinol methylase